MEKRKIIMWSSLILCAVVVVIVVALLCFKNDGSGEKVTVRPLNESVSLEEVFGEIKLIDGVSEGEFLADEIDFGKYSGLEKMAMVNTMDQLVDEVWMVKLGSLEQQEDVCRIFGRRVQKLKAGFEDDAEQSKVLDDAVVKQEDGIVIMIVSPYVDEIEEKIADVMGRM